MSPSGKRRKKSKKKRKKSEKKGKKARKKEKRKISEKKRKKAKSKKKTHARMTSGKSAVTSVLLNVAWSKSRPPNSEGPGR